MKKLFVLVLVLVGCTTAQAGFMDTVDKLVTGGQQVQEQIPQTQEEATPQPRYEAPATGEDRHYIQDDDFFTQGHGMGDQAWIWVELAKMTTAPTSKTKGEAEFMKIKDGKNYWTKHHWKSRIASPSELRMGLMVIAFNDNNNNDRYDAPAKKDEARGGSWFMARITDLSDLYKGHVTLSGNYKVSPRNLRVLIAK